MLSVRVIAISKEHQFTLILHACYVPMFLNFSFNSFYKVTSINYAQYLVITILQLE